MAAVNQGLDPNEVLPSGLTRFQKRSLARDQGFTGNFGSGEHTAFLNEDPTRREDFDSAITREVSRQNRVFGSTQAFREATGKIDALSAVRSGLSFAKVGSSSAVAPLANAIDNAAANAFPSVFKQGGSFIGPSAPGTVSLSGTIMGAGTGFAIGSTLGAFTGLKQDGASVGGAIGGAVGSVVPGLGTIAGSIIGSAIGGFFGPSKPVRASEFVTKFNEKGQAVDLGLGAKGVDTDQGKSIGQSFGVFVEKLNTGLGADLANVQAFGGYNDKYEGGFFVRTDQHAGAAEDIREKFDPSDAATVEDAFFNTTDRLLRVNADKNIEIIGRIDELKATGLSSKEALQTIYDERLGLKAQDALEKPNAPIASIPTTPEGRITQKVVNSTNQINAFLDKVEQRKVGRDETIKTGPLGLLEDAPVIKKQLGSIAIV